MPSPNTTVEIYSSILNILNKIGITPIHKASVTHSKSEALASTTGNNTESRDDKKSCSTSIIENHHFDTNTGSLLELISTFPIIRFVNARNNTVMFWVMFSFCYGTALPSIYKLIETIQETKRAKLAVTTTPSESQAKIGTPVLVASFVWVIYSMTCCAVYFVHFFKADKVCRFLTNWQIVEGELITESKAINANGGSVESFIKWQKKGLFVYTATIPFSFILMCFASTYNVKFPMYIYASMPPAWEEGRPWIQPLCLLFAWFQVGLFLICESQTELITIAFTRSVYKCLEILNQPATDFYNRLNNRHNHFYPRPRPTLILESDEVAAAMILKMDTTNKKTITGSDPHNSETLLLFHDSVERYESLNHLVNEFNAIFRWPLFVRKAFTMAKICCYLYLLLRHPLDAAFPGFVIFFYGGLVIFSKFGGILSLMASVRGESEKFLREWKKVLLTLFPSGIAEEERILARCSVLSFKMANFYSVKSQTLLTFSSVVLTYLIILLQLE